MLSSPNHIGKYELISRLGRGGMGEVYKAFHPQLQRYVAIKVLLSSSETDPEFIARFQHEAMAIARLRHPHIVQVFDFDIEGNTPYMVMEFVEGETLAQRIARFQRAGQVMPVDEAVRLVQQICAAVDYAHKQGMLHRDIKPANVIINRQSDTILTDFGLAKIQGGSGLTASGVVVGTPHYMSPEQAQGQPVDERSDIYSLCVLLYELLAGKLPFDADTPVGVIMQHITAPPPPLEQVNPAVPTALAQVALVGMAKRPAERFRTAGALSNAISVALSSLQVPIASSASTYQTSSPPDAYKKGEIAPSQEAPGGSPRQGRVASSADTAPPTTIEQANLQAQSGLSLTQQSAPPTERIPQTPSATAPGVTPPRHNPSGKNKLGRFALLGIIVMLLALSGGVLIIALSSNSSTPVNTASTPIIIGTVTFSDSDPNDFNHPANVLTGTFSKMQHPAPGTTYFAWLCDSGTSACTQLGPVQVDDAGKGRLSVSNAHSFLGVQDPNKLNSTLTFEITQEEAEASTPPHRPSSRVIYTGQLQAKVLLHIRHQLAAFPKQSLFTGNTTALDTGLGVDATLLQRLSRQMQQAQARNDLATMQQIAESILNLLAGKEGATDWNRDGHTIFTQGDDGFGLGTQATINPNDCAGQNNSYLPLTLQHACLAARSSGTPELQRLFSMIQSAGTAMVRALATIEQLAQHIAAAQETSAISQGDVNTLAAQADTVLQGVTGEAQSQDGARQILSYSEQMATIIVSAL